MKKLLTLALALILAMGALGLVACGGDGATNGESMTKDEFITELKRREAATFADTALHYATVDCKLIINIGDEYDGTYEQTCDIHYGTDQYEKDFAYTSVKKGSGNNTSWQQQRLFCADYLVGTFADMPADLLSAFKFEKDGDTLRLLCDTTYNGVKLYMEYKFGANGYLLYRKESQGNASDGESVEFTAKVYNKTKDLEVQAFLTYLRGLEGDSYNNLRYATVTATDIEQIGSNPRTTDTGDFKLKYSLDGNDNLIAEAEIRDGDGHLESTITVLGLSGLMSQHVEEYPNGEYAVKKVGSNYDVTAEIDSENGHISVHYVFDKDGYMVYGLIRQGDEYMTEFTATAYNKKSASEETVVRYEFTSATSDEGYFADSYIELSGDNAAKSYLHGGEYIGTYTLNGDNISIRTYNGSVGIFWDGVIDGDVLTLTAGGIVVVYTKSAN